MTDNQLRNIAFWLAIIALTFSLLSIAIIGVKEAEIMELKKGHFYDVCEGCGKVFELDPEKDLILLKEGHHPNCDEKGAHYHLRTAGPICPKCKGS